MKRLLFTFAFILFIHSVTHAQFASRFLIYGVKDGLSQNSVHAIHRDKDGLIWIGTQDGLNSFDGKRFTVYRYNEDDSTSISDQFVLRIQEDKKGNLWIGTRNGLNHFNKRTGKFKRIYLYENEKHIFQADYSDFFVQPDGNLAVKKEHVFIINANTLKPVKQVPPSLKKSNWFITPGYKAWITDEDNRFFYSADIRQNKFTDFGLSPFSRKENCLNYIAIPYNDLLFIYDRLKASEIIVFDTRTHKVRKKIPVPFNFSHLNVISEEEILASTSKGIFRAGLSGRSEMFLSGPASGNILPAGTILSTFKDGAGNLWVGTSGNGLAVSNSSFNNFLQISLPAQNEVISCLAKSGTTLYAGTRSGLYKIENFTGTVTYKFTPLIAGKGITAITADNEQNIWAAIQGEGISIYNETGTKIRTVLLHDDPAGITVLHMKTDSKGRILISTTAGFFIVPPGNATVIPFSAEGNLHSISGDYVMNAFEDKEGNIWISNNSGIDVYTGFLEKKFSFVSDDDKSSFIKRTIVTAAAQDNTGAIWIGTIRGGIYKYQHGKYTHYTTSAGLASDVVYNVLCDYRGRIWAATSAGLNIFNEKKNSFTALSTADGVPAAAFIFGAALTDDRNILYGTSEGLLICNAERVALHDGNFNAFVSDVKVNGQSIQLNDYMFTIMPDGKLISFDFSSSPAFFSGNIIYQYRLLGQQNEWINLPAGVHAVSYTGLPYKDLAMQVRAAGSVNNLASAPVFSVVIQSRAPFWKTTAFIIIAAMLFIISAILLAMAVNKRKYNKELRALQVEKGLQGERVRIGRDLHDNIGAYTSALIAGLNRIQPGNESQHRHVADLKEYGANIMGFLRETIWMLNTETLTITAFADRFKNYAMRISKNYTEIDFRFIEEIEDNKVLPPALMLNIFRILQEALQNACKHSGATVITTTVRNKEKLYFEVSDNGKGFWDMSGAENYGLSNMKQRAAESGYLLNIESSKAGTNVSIIENTANAALLTGDQRI